LRKSLVPAGTDFCGSAASLVISEIETLAFSLAIKTLDVIFDNKLNLSDHVNNIVSIYCNHRNLGRIPFKLLVY